MTGIFYKHLQLYALFGVASQYKAGVAERGKNSAMAEINSFIKIYGLTLVSLVAVAAVRTLAPPLLQW